jgi:hypothetical protein
VEFRGGGLFFLGIAFASTVLRNQAASVAGVTNEPAGRRAVHIGLESNITAIKVPNITTDFISRTQKHRRSNLNVDGGP